MPERLDWPGRARRILAPAALLLLLSAVLPAADAAEIAAAEPYPQRGVETVVVVAEGAAPVAGLEVTARYRPNSQTGSTEIVGLTGTDGAVAWTPSDAGVVSLEARRPGAEEVVAAADVSVRFGGFPASGLLIMALAALLLFGGAGAGFFLLLRTPARLPVEEPPST